MDRVREWGELCAQERMVGTNIYIRGTGKITTGMMEHVGVRYSSFPAKPRGKRTV